MNVLHALSECRIRSWFIKKLVCNNCVTCYASWILLHLSRLFVRTYLRPLLGLSWKTEIWRTDKLSTGCFSIRQQMLCSYHKSCAWSPLWSSYQYFFILFICMSLAEWSSLQWAIFLLFSVKDFSGVFYLPVKFKFLFTSGLS